MKRAHVIRKSLRGTAAVLFLLFCFFGCQGGPGERDYRRALKEWEAGRLIRARASMEKAIRKRAGDERNAVAFNQLGLILWQLNEPRRALEAFSSSRQVDADRYDAACNLGLAFARQNNLKNARALLTEASLMRPQDPRPLELLGQALLRAGHWEEAQRVLEHALSREPGSLRIRTALAVARFNRGGSVQPAIQQLREVLGTEADYAPALFNLAVMLQHTGAVEEARRTGERYLAVVPEGSGALQIRQLLDGKKHAAQPAPRPREGALSFSRPAVPSREVADQAFSEAFRLYAEGRYEQAAKYYIRAIEADDTYENAFYNLALTYHALERFVHAKAACEEALALNPGNAEARYLLALVCYNLQQFDEAETHVRAVLRKHSEDAQAANLLNLIQQARRSAE